MTQQTVAILGASSDRTKYGNISVRAHLRQGYQVFPVNPKGEPIEGLQTYRSLAEIPDRIERISVYLPPKILLESLPEIARIEHQELFLNPGTDSPEVLRLAHDLGLEPIVACSIVALGQSPDEVP